LKYRVSDTAGWVIIRPSGKAQNNEPLRVRYLFRRWLSRDGVRVIVDGGWGLVRASNTQPLLVLRWEATSEARLREIQRLIERTVQEIREELA